MVVLSPTLPSARCPVDEQTFQMGAASANKPNEIDSGEAVVAIPSRLTEPLAPNSALPSIRRLQPSSPAHWRKDLTGQPGEVNGVQQAGH